MFVLTHSEHHAGFAEHVTVLSKIERLMIIIKLLMVSFFEKKTLFKYLTKIGKAFLNKILSNIPKSNL
jgi:hypothetical protein